MPTTCPECDAVFLPRQLYCRRCGALPEENEEATLSALFDDVFAPIAIPIGTDDFSLDPTLATVATASVTLCDTCADVDLDKDLEAQITLNTVDEQNEGNTTKMKKPASKTKDDHENNSEGFLKRCFCCFSSTKKKIVKEPAEEDDEKNEKGCFARLFGCCACSKKRTEEEELEETPAFSNVNYGGSNSGGCGAKRECVRCYNKTDWESLCCCVFSVLFLGGLAGLIAWLALDGDGSGGYSSGSRSSYVGYGGYGSRSGSSYGGGSSSSSSCFPGDSLVEIKRPGEGAEKSRFIYIKDVQLNDEVRSGHGFSTVYAFGTKIPGDGAPPVQMLQLRTESGHVLETTKNHLVYAGKGLDQSKAVLARDVIIGDLVSTFEGPLCDNDTSPILQASRVVAINNVSKEEGTYHPLTKDGNIIVNGVLASAHAVDGVVPKVEVLGMDIIGIQAFQQLLYSPLRVLCSLSPEEFCSEIHHDLEDGSHLYLNVMEPLLRFLFPKTSWVDQVDDQQEEVNFLEKAPYLALRISLLQFLLFSFMIEAFLSHLALTVSILVTVTLAFAAMSRKKIVCIKKEKVKRD